MKLYLIFEYSLSLLQFVVHWFVESTKTNDCNHDVYLVSAGALLGNAGKDGEAVPRHSYHKDRKVSVPSVRKPRPLRALVQERQRVQEGSEDRRVQGE